LRVELEGVGVGVKSLEFGRAPWLLIDPGEVCPHGEGWIQRRGNRVTALRQSSSLLLSSLELSDAKVCDFLKRALLSHCGERTNVRMGLPKNETVRGWGSGLKAEGRGFNRKVDIRLHGKGNSNLPWRKAGQPRHLVDVKDSDQ
jgi:hypothetical protein